MSTADEWRARFAEQRLAAEAAWRFERAMHSARVAALIKAEHAPQVTKNLPIILEPGHEIDSGADGSGCPSAARRVESAALAAGWVARTVRSVAAIPRTGILEVVTVRGARHDERFWAAWWNGRFECAQYLRRGEAIERLGFRTVKARRGVMDAIEGRRLEST